MNETTTVIQPRKVERSKWNLFIANVKRYKYSYMMFIPVLAYYLIFSYGPMYGAIIAFKDYYPAKGIFGSDWAGLKHFIAFFTNPKTPSLIWNTLILGLYGIVSGFFAPLIFALLINELRNQKFKRVVQSLTYFPHFVSLVVVCGLVKTFTLSNGIIVEFMVALGGVRRNLLGDPDLFRTIYVTANIWQGVGWGSIIYLAALAGIDVQLYEACEVDGGGKFRKMWHITIPGIMPTVIIMLIMKMGQVLNVGYEKILLLYSPMTYETADVISTYVYRMGIEEQNWSFSTAVGLFNSVINLAFLTTANAISRKVKGISLW